MSMALLVLLSALVATPERAPSAVAIHLEDRGLRASLDVTCARGATSCRSVLTDALGLATSDVAWSTLAPIVDDVARSSLMRGGSNRDGSLVWRVAIGATKSRSAERVDEASDAHLLWKALAREVPARPAHPAAEFVVSRFGGDPAARLETMTIRCEADALWCACDFAPAWLAPAVTALAWRRLAVVTARPSDLMNADAFVTTREGSEQSTRWTWRIDLGGGVANTAGLARTLTPDSMRWLFDVVRWR